MFQTLPTSAQREVRNNFLGARGGKAGKLVIIASESQSPCMSILFSISRQASRKKFLAACGDGGVASNR